MIYYEQNGTRLVSSVAPGVGGQALIWLPVPHYNLRHAFEFTRNTPSQIMITHLTGGIGLWVC